VNLPKGGQANSSFAACQETKGANGGQPSLHLNSLRLGINLSFPSNLHLRPSKMDEFNSETDSDYASYWRDWVCSATFPRVLRLESCPASPEFR